MSESVIRNAIENVLRGPASPIQGPRRIVRSIADLDTSIAMGGLLGYYSNSSGSDANFVVEALKKINCPHAAALIAQANKLFRGGFPCEDWDARLHQLTEMTEEDEEHISSIGSSYLRYPDGLGDKFEEYVRANLSELAKHE